MADLNIEHLSQRERYLMTMVYAAFLGYTKRQDDAARDVNDIIRAADELEPAYASPQPAAEFPECSGNPRSCPENEGYGCCKPNPKCSCPSGDGSLAWPCEAHPPQPSASVGERARELLAESSGNEHVAAIVRNTAFDGGMVQISHAIRAIESALTTAAGGGGEVVARCRVLVQTWRDEAERIGKQEEHTHSPEDYSGFLDAKTDELEAALGRGGAE